MAVTLRLEVIGTAQTAVLPAQSPLQLENMKLADAGVAVRLTAVPVLKVAVQVPSTLVQATIPAGELLTAPPGVGATVSVGFAAVMVRRVPATTVPVLAVAEYTCVPAVIGVV